MSRQSPIDIKDAVSGSFDSILDIKFETITGPAAQNTGHCLHLDTVGHIEGKLSGGPLVAATYSLQQFHFHWGDDADKGSEHTVEGEMASAELHFVFKNDKYNSVGDAVVQGDGLAVLGVILRETDSATTGVMPELFNNVPQAKGESIELASSLDLSSALPTNRSYYTYLGSLTTPTYNECVTWIVFKDEVQLSGSIMANLRNMSTGEGSNKIVNNYREVQDLAGRQVTLVEA